MLECHTFFVFDMFAQLHPIKYKKFEKQMLNVLECYECAAYPSATKKSPFEATATSVGLQKWLLSLPGTSFVPRTRLGVVDPRGIFITYKHYNEHLSFVCRSTITTEFERI